MFKLTKDSERYSLEFDKSDNPNAELFIFNKGTAYYDNGKIWEYGGWFVNDNESITISENLNTNEVRTVFENKEDPIAVWKSELKNMSTGDVIHEKYETTRFVRAILAGMNFGNLFLEYQKHDSIPYWIGKRENEKESELYFNVTGSKHLKEISEFYGLSYPVDERITKIIDTDRTAIRYQSADLLNLGEGKFIEILLGGIVFENKIPKMLKFYTVTRRSHPDI